MTPGNATNDTHDLMGSELFELVRGVSTDLAGEPNPCNLAALERLVDSGQLSRLSDNEDVEGKLDDNEGRVTVRSVDNESRGDREGSDDWKPTVFQYLVFPVHLILKDEKTLALQMFHVLISI